MFDGRPVQRYKEEIPYFAMKRIRNTDLACYRRPIDRNRINIYIYMRIRLGTQIKSKRAPHTAGFIGNECTDRGNRLQTTCLLPIHTCVTLVRWSQVILRQVYRTQYVRPYNRQIVFTYVWYKRIFFFFIISHENWKPVLKCTYVYVCVCACVRAYCPTIV